MAFARTTGLKFNILPQTAANDPEFKTLLAQNNALPLYLPPERAIKWYDEQRKLYRDIMDKAGILKEK